MGKKILVSFSPNANVILLGPSLLNGIKAVKTSTSPSQQQGTTTNLCSDVTRHNGDVLTFHAELLWGANVNH